MRRARADFTLVELMVVVTLIGIISSLAVMSIKRSRSGDDADGWANTFRNMVNQVRRRAVATGSTYMIDLQQNSIQWCQISDPANCSALSTTPTCPNTATGMENGVKVYAPSWGVTAGYNAAADIALPNSTYTAVSTPTAVPSGGVVIYFGANGTVDETYTSVRCLTPAPNGVTLYFKSSTNSTNTSSEGQKRRKVVVYGLSGRPRIIDTW